MVSMILRFLLVISVLTEKLWLVALNDDDRFGVSLGPCFLDIGDPCASDKISFYFYTLASKDDPVNITVTDVSLPVGFNVSAKTKVLIHGYAGNVGFNGVVALRKAYQDVGNFNIIVVDWGELVRLPCYPVAVLNTIQAGKCTALLLDNLASLQGSDVTDFHIIGFSLGAHVASFASNELKAKKQKKVERITGLDPALPFFASLANSWKLDKEDAHFVDIIHTNVGIFGKIEATGHVDFYVNEGYYQPACNGAANAPLCSHIMSLRYFAESVTTPPDDGFWGVPCSSYIDHLLGLCKETDLTSNKTLMGEYCDYESRGVYFVRTSDTAPYALGKLH